MSIGYNYLFAMRNLSLILCVLLASGVCSVHGTICDVQEAEKCKIEIISFESVYFPFYGSNEEELDQTCRDMNKTLECLQDFVLNCYEKPECQDDCPTAVAEIASLWRNTGVPALYNQLCFEGHPYRESYLEHYSCLQKTIDEYAICYNTSQESQVHISTLYEEPEKHLAATCCFFSWYQDCYTNATTESCGLNATFVVSYALHLLTGHIVQQMCNPPTFCDKPPMLEPFEASTTGESTTIENFDSGVESHHVWAKTNLSFILVFMVFIHLYAKV